MPRLGFIRPELSKVLNRYRIIRDCLTGSEAVKSKGREYLPMPNSEDWSKENLANYAAYKARAVFYNFTSRTLEGYIGLIFSRTPVSEIDDRLDVIETNATGDGVTLEQLAQKTLAYSLSYGRSGVMVDFTATDGLVSLADVENGLARPTITTYDPFSIINWRYETIGGVSVLKMVNLAEEWPYQDDGFEIKTACQFKVLYLDQAGNYHVEVWRQNSPRDWSYRSPIPPGEDYMVVERYAILDPKGKPVKEILFKFAGVKNNDGSIDNPPLYDLADLNIAHYRNSADYEHANYMMGQPTYWFSGLSEDWVEKVLGGQIRLGSSGGVLLPEGGSAGLLQMEANSSVKEAMDAKEKQAASLGAKIMEPTSVQRTATEAKQDNHSETSILSAAAKNVSTVYEWALEKCQMFMGIETAKTPIYKLNSDFQMMNASAADRAQLMKEWQGGGITFGEFRAVLVKLGIATEDEKSAATIIANEQAAAMEQAAKAIELNTAAGGGNETP